MKACVSVEVIVGSVSGVRESEMRGGGDGFLVSLRIL